MRVLGTKTYCPRTTTNRNSAHQVQPQQSTPTLNRKARRQYAKLLKGMDGHQCHLLTFTNGRRIDLTLRQEAYRMFRTRAGKRWPDYAAFTIYEYSEERGVHLHVVVKGTLGLDAQWVKHIVELVGDGTRVHVEPIGREHQDHRLDELGIAHYLTKQIADEKVMAGWPKGFHVTSSTRNWCPSWLSRRAWGEYRRSLRNQAHHG